MSKDKSGDQAVSTFGPDDTIYAIARVTSAGKAKVAGQLMVEDVDGQQKGPIPGLDQTLDVDNGMTATFSYTKPTNGWPKGKYKIDIVLLNDKAEKVDEKSASFSVQ